MPSVLLLHGYKQTAEIMKSKTKKLFNSNYNLEFLDGGLELGNNTFGWWHIDRDRIFENRFSYNVDFINNIKEKVRTEPDFIVGFSQGCNVAMIMLIEDIFPKIKGVIFIGAGPMLDDKCLPLEKIRVPSLHIIGLNDPICDSSYSEIFMNYFEQPRLHYHDKGHVIPTQSKDKVAIKEFMETVK